MFVIVSNWYVQYHHHISVPYFNAGTSTGGGNTHTLRESEMPRHTHTPYFTTVSDNGNPAYGLSPAIGYQGAIVINAHPKSVTMIGSTGSNLPHNNMPAYQTLYAWRRTA